jgi:hypothetical protein
MQKRRRVMLDRLIEMIERHAGSMAEELKERLVNDPSTSSYKSLDERSIYDSIFEVYSRLGHWLLKDSEKGEVRTHYSNIGAQRFEQGFPLDQLIQALVATKRHIWDTVLHRGIMTTAKELDTAIDFITYLNRFFDMAIYYTTLGYYKMLVIQTRD